MLIRPLVLPETATKGDVPARVMKITINNNPHYFCLLWVAQENR